VRARVPRITGTVGGSGGAPVVVDIASGPAGSHPLGVGAPLSMATVWATQAWVLAALGTVRAKLPK